MKIEIPKQKGNIMVFERERQLGIKCINLLCQFYKEGFDINCEAVRMSSSERAYFSCVLYLPEKLKEEIILDHVCPNRLCNNKNTLETTNNNFYCYKCGCRWGICGKGGIAGIVGDDKENEIIIPLKDGVVANVK